VAPSASLALLMSTAFAGGCSETLVRVQPTEVIRPDTAGEGLEVAVSTLALPEELIERGVTEDAALAVGLRLHNGGEKTYGFSAASCWLLLEGDDRRPAETLSFAPAGGGEGEVPGELDDDLAFRAVNVAPGETRTVWIVFRGYRFPKSDVARRVVLAMPGLGGQPVRLRLADPSQGDLRWETPTPRSRFMVAISGSTLFGAETKSQLAGSTLSRVARAGRFLWDVGLDSGFAVQSEGRLVSSRSSFATLKLGLHLTAPLVTWGPWQDPRRFGVFGGGGMGVWTALPTPAETRAGEQPRAYGHGFMDLGVEFDFGTWRPAATPFPLGIDPKPGLPRWSLRLGYTQSWFAHGTSPGYMTAASFSF